MERHTLTIKLDTSQYRQPTQDDINAAKKFILRRNEYAQMLEAEIDDFLKDAAQAIVTICYKYNVDPQKFSINSQYNAEMMDEIAKVMDELEEEILALIDEYSTAVVDKEDKDKRTALLLWLATLGRGNRNLQDTLDTYLYKTMKDWEAAIAALMSAGVGLSDSITKIKTYIHSIYTMPEVIAAFKHAEDFAAEYIRSRGVNKGAVGLSNNGSTNVTQMARTTLNMAWMRLQAMDFKENGAAGYYQLRGSNYPCDICDDEVGFHQGIADIYIKPYPHPHCMCYRIPIYSINV